MRNTGLLLISIGFLGGALMAVLDPAAIDWSWFFACFAVGVVGVALVRIALRRAATDPVRTRTNLAILTTSLGGTVKALDALDRDKGTIDVYDLPERIDRDLRGDILAFADARESIMHVYGTMAYAGVMSHFAAGERYLNRVWSCAAEGYIDEAHDYITRSREQFAEALDKLNAATAASGPGAGAQPAAG